MAIECSNPDLGALGKLFERCVDAMLGEGKPRNLDMLVLPGGAGRVPSAGITVDMVSVIIC